MNKKIFTSFLSITLLVLPWVAFADALDINQIIINLLTIVVWPVFIGSAIIMFIYAGILFLTANGDPAKISTARKAVLWGVIGVVVAIAAFSAVGIISQVISGGGGSSGGGDF